ncbi:MAG TPA: protein kinase [Planctomycetota bacterium]|nr:protein kinase [Planctomycetota bacterium]
MSQRFKTLQETLEGLPRVSGVPTLGGIALTGVLGSGGMGMVYKGLHLRLSIPVAVKILHNQSTGLYSQFFEEARLAAKINHPNVVRVYDVNEEHGLVYIVQELVDGGSAYDLIQDNAGDQKFLPELRLLDLGTDIARALAAIHNESIVHLDIKPENVLIERGTGAAKITDLGLARRSGRFADTSIAGTEVYGTPGFMSPEQLQALPAGPAADVYAFGALFYELAVNTMAFHFKNNLPELFLQQTEKPLPDPLVQRKSLAPRIAAIIRKCLAPFPQDRFADGAALLRELIETRSQLQPRSPTGVVPVQRASLGAQVVCVDDDPALREFVEDAMAEASHSVETFSNGRDALAYLASHEPDLVLLDVDMPGDNGLKVCRSLRGIPALKEVPVVFMSGVHDLNVIDTAMGLGATDYLLKPVSVPDLLARVNCLTRLRRVQRERAALEAQYQKLSSHLIAVSHSRNRS